MTETELQPPIVYIECAESMGDDQVQTKRKTETAVNSCTLVMNLGFGASLVVAKKLEVLPGLRRVHFDAVNGSVWVDYDPTRVSVGRIRSACAYLGSGILTI